MNGGIGVFMFHRHACTNATICCASRCVQTQVSSNSLNIHNPKTCRIKTTTTKQKNKQTKTAQLFTVVEERKRCKTTLLYNTNFTPSFLVFTPLIQLCLSQSHIHSPELPPPVLRNTFPYHPPVPIYTIPYHPPVPI